MTCWQNRDGEWWGAVTYSFPTRHIGSPIQDRTTGWIHYGARYYDPTTGSFTQQDSLDAPLDPLNANRYAYAGNDPINITDPRGYAGSIDSAGACVIGAACAGVSGGVGLAVVGSVVPVIGTSLGAVAGFIGGVVGGCAAGVVTQALTEKALED
nr:RHS repeat-associated core domain-containing protein [Auraticoccus cholistanensis]